MIDLTALPLLRHGNTDIFDAIKNLADRDPLMIAAVALIFAFIAFIAVQEVVTGRSFVKSSGERREARRRRKRILWDYDRDDD